jgi:hypothetical protein
MTREVVRNVIGTPLFTVTNSSTYCHRQGTNKATIGAGETWSLSLSDIDNFNKYSPFNVVEILDGGTSNIKFYWNGRDDLGFFTFAGNTRSIQREGFNCFRIENVGANDITPEQLEVSFFRTGLTADEKARQDVLRPVSISDILKKFKLVSY